MFDYARCFQYAPAFCTFTGYDGTGEMRVFKPCSGYVWHPLPRQTSSILNISGKWVTLYNWPHAVWESRLGNWGNLPPNANDVVDRISIGC